MPRLFLRLFFDTTMFGPGKAELLERIRDTGSISAAGRAMGMSYKRAWLLVEEMNAAFASPLVDSARGGSGGGGARLTPTGETALALYRRIETTAATAASHQIATLEGMLKPGGDMSDRK